MKKDLARKLNAKAQEIALAFSNPDREFNHGKETFIVSEIKPLSEVTAAILFKKNTGKIGMAFCYWTNGGGGKWNYFFPTDSHVLGMGKVAPLLNEVEEHNFPLN
jgi:hypothetical protein